MKHFKKWAPVYWMVWLLVGLTVPELYAVFNNDTGDTFSEFWWHLFGITGRAPLWLHVSGTIFTVAFGTWLVGHLAFGWWGGPNKPPFTSKPPKNVYRPKHIERRK